MRNFNICLTIIMIVLFFCASAIIGAKIVVSSSQTHFFDKNVYKEIVNLRHNISKCQHSIYAAIKGEKANESEIKKEIEKLSLRLLVIEG